MVAELAQLLQALPSRMQHGFSPAELGAVRSTDYLRDRRSYMRPQGSTLGQGQNAAANPPMIDYDSYNKFGAYGMSPAQTMYGKGALNAYSNYSTGSSQNVTPGTGVIDDPLAYMINELYKKRTGEDKYVPTLASNVQPVYWDQDAWSKKTFGN